jgi:excisionase family DNA binding protein
MLLTIREVSQLLHVKPSTLYAWAAQGRIPCFKLHGLVRFRREDIDQWLESFRAPSAVKAALPDYTKRGRDIDEIIAAAKRAIYNPRHGETGPALSPRKGE